MFQESGLVPAGRLVRTMRSCFLALSLNEDQKTISLILTHCSL